MERLMCYFDNETAVPRGCCTFDRESDTEPDDCISCGEMCEEKDGDCEECPIQKAFNKLAEYENLSENGLLEIFPCKVGDTVYTNTSMQGWYFRKENRPYEARVVFIGINGADNFINVDFGNGRMLQFNFSHIGKTVFITKDQAEQALKEMEEGNEGN